MPTERKASLKRNPLEVAIGVVIIVATLYFAQDVLIPLALSVLLTFLLTPVVSRLQRRGLPAIPAVLLTTLAAFVLVLGLGSIVGSQLYSLASDLEKYKANITKKYDRVSAFGGSIGAKFTKFGSEIAKAKVGKTEPSSTADAAKTAAKDAVANPVKAAAGEAGNVPATAPADASAPPPAVRGTSADQPLFVSDISGQESPVRTLLTYVDKVLSPLGTGALVVVFVVFMLLDRQDLRDRAIRLVSRGKYTVTTRALDDAGQRISRYVLAQTIVNGSYGVVVGAGLWLIGVFVGHGTGFPSFVLWGLLAAVLRFIPYIGPVAAAAFPLTLSLAVYDGFTVFVAVGVMLILIELISNNVMEPWLYGSSTGLSTMAILVAAVFWTWLWGPIGLFMSTPLTVCIVVLGKHVTQFKFLDVMLGDQPALPPGVRFYQRLLAGDANEAEAVMNEIAKVEGGHEVPDRVLVPALRLARRDYADNDLSPDEESTLLDMTAKLLERRNVECETRADAAREKSNAGDAAAIAPVVPKVVGCPAHHRSEELALRALDQLGLPDAFCINTLSSRLMHTQVEQKVREVNPALVFIAIVPPGGGPQARFLCKRLRKAFPDLPIVVGYFGKVRDFDRLLVRFRKSGASYVTTSVKQSRDQILALLRVSAG